MNYIIIPAENLDYVDFTTVKEDNPSTLRYSLDGKYFFVKYDGEQPDFVFNITQDSVGLIEYSHQEIIEILKGPEWSSQD